jgi:hypothetical protein
LPYKELPGDLARPYRPRKVSMTTLEPASSTADTSDSPTARARSPRGFAAMPASKQREIASLGGKAAHQSGHAHEFTSEEARIAGRKRHQKISIT